MMLSTIARNVYVCTSCMSKISTRVHSCRQLPLSAFQNAQTSHAFSTGPALFSSKKDDNDAKERKSTGLKTKKSEGQGASKVTRERRQRTTDATQDVQEAVSDQKEPGSGAGEIGNEGNIALEPAKARTRPKKPTTAKKHKQATAKNIQKTNARKVADDKVIGDVSEDPSYTMTRVAGRRRGSSHEGVRKAMQGRANRELELARKSTKTNASGTKEPASVRNGYHLSRVYNRLIRWTKSPAKPSEYARWMHEADDRIRGYKKQLELLTSPAFIQEMLDKDGEQHTKRFLKDVLRTDMLSIEEKSNILVGVKSSLPDSHIPLQMALKAEQGRSRNTSKPAHAFRNIKDAMQGKTISKNSASKLEKTGMKDYEVKTIKPEELNFQAVEKEQPPVPLLSYGLERVLFNPGVYHLQDPRSRVFNFDPYLQKIMPVSEFDFSALKEYITSSRDEALLSVAAEEKKKYTGSTSSMTAVLSHLHFLLSHWRPVTTEHLSKGFPSPLESFTAMSRSPSAIFLRHRDGVYAIDADKEYDTANILMMLGKSMEKLLTLPTEEFEKYRRDKSDQISLDDRNSPESYHYSTLGDFLMRSQLDAYDPRIPGTGMFDLKTRAVLSIRMDVNEYQEGTGYEIRSRLGEYESFEREYYDMIRSAFLKYSLQVRMGRMDGIFVAYHNTERIFGFQYVSISEMDYAIHGTEDRTLGDDEFKTSIDLLNRAIDRATTTFPGKSLRMHFETRDGKVPFTYIFAEPVEEDEIEEIQQKNKAKIEEFEREVLGLNPPPKSADELAKEAEWQNTQAQIEEDMYNDEIGLTDAVDELISSAAHSEAVPKPNSQDAENGMVQQIDDNYQGDEPGASAADFDNEDGVEDVDEEGDEEIDQEDENATDGDNEEGNEEDVEDIVEQDENLEEQVSGDETQKINQEKAGRNVMDSTEEALSVDEAQVSAPAETAAASSEETEKVTSQSLTDTVPEMDSTLADQAPEAQLEQKELLAMILTVRSKVNGRYVDRPEKLNPSDSWRVEYSLSEVAEPERAWSLYNSVKTRRARTHAKTAGDKRQDAWNNKFISSLKDCVQRGRDWRTKQDEFDKDKPTKILYPEGVQTTGTDSVKDGEGQKD